MTSNTANTTNHGPDHEPDDEVVRPPDARPAASPGPMRAIGMPAEKSKDFGGSTKRLLARMRTEKGGKAWFCAFADVSVTLTPALIGPRCAVTGPISS